MNRFEYTKFAEAHRVLYACFGDNGVWADPSRYRRQCWTRDFGMAILPTLIDIGSADAMKVAGTHLANIRERQEPSGQIPILYLDGLKGHARFLADKVARSLRDGQPSFMLRRYIECKGSLAHLTPGTTDSELHYITTVLDYAEATDTAPPVDTVQRALEFVEQNYMRNGLHVGADWRDTMEVELQNTPLLSNNSLLHGIYERLGYNDKADKLFSQMQEAFWINKHAWRDRPTDNRFDPLGASLGVLNGTLGPRFYEDIYHGFRSVDTKYGVTIKCKHNPISAKEKEVINRTDGVVIWPFVVGFSVLALNKMAKMWSLSRSKELLEWEVRAFARDQYGKLLILEGFREWYDPEDGQGYGAQEQLWSATLTARAIKVMRGDVK